MTSLSSTLTGPVIAVAADLLSDLASPAHAVGAYVETADGRGFRYAKVGGTSTVAGKLYQSAAQDATNQNPSGGIAVAAAAIGATSVTLTASLTLTANVLAGGYMSVAVTPGQGYTYRVAGNTAVSSAANCVVTLADPLVVALTTSSKVTFFRHPYDSVIVNPTTATGGPVGVANSIITNAQYGWLQTRGACSVLTDSGTTVGLGVAPSAATAGAVKTAATTLCTIGFAVETCVTTEYDIVFLTIG